MVTHPPSLKSWQLHAKTADHALLFTAEEYLNPHCQEYYYGRLVAPLKLDDPFYFHVDHKIMSE